MPLLCSLIWVLSFQKGNAQLQGKDQLNYNALDSICNNYLIDNISAHPYVPYWVDMGRDFNWSHNPIEPSAPNFSKEWSWVVVSRMKFVSQLADAYNQTGQEKYGSKALFFLKDFYQKANLSRASKADQELLWRGLDIAIRASTLANVYPSIKKLTTYTASDEQMISSLAHQHGQRLYAILTKDAARTGNHVTTESYGLFVIAAMFPAFKEADQWRMEAINRFKREIDRVVPPDGFQAELSPSYHYGVVAPYHGFYEMANKYNIKLPETFLSRLKEMYRAPVLMMDQSGGLVPTNDSSPRDVRKLSKKGLELGDDPLLLWAVSGGKKGIAPPTSTMLPYAGFYTMRSGWKPNDLFLFFRGGPEGIGHAEQDMLQVVLRAYGKTLLFDPGKYAYDQSDWRRYTINTSAHNTIVVDGKWQNREKVIPDKFVAMQNPWFTSPLLDFVSATYKAGYETNMYDDTKTYRPQKWKGDRDTTVSHTRKVIYLKPNYTLIFDELEGIGKHTFDAHFHIDAPKAKMVPSNQAVYSERPDSIQIALFPLERQNLKTEIIQGQKEPLLGWMPAEHRAIPTVRFRKEQGAPATFATLLYPYKGKDPNIIAKDIKFKSTGIWGQVLHAPSDQIEIVISQGKFAKEISFSSTLVGKVNAKAEGLMIRRNKEINHVKIAGWKMSSYSDGQMEFTLSSPTTINLIQKAGFITIGNSGDQTVKVTFGMPYRKSIMLGAGQWMDVSGKGEKNVAAPAIQGLTSGN